MVVDSRMFVKDSARLSLRGVHGVATGVDFKWPVLLQAGAGAELRLKEKGARHSSQASVEGSVALPPAVCAGVWGRRRHPCALRCSLCICSSFLMEGVSLTQDCASSSQEAVPFAYPWKVHSAVSSLDKDTAPMLAVGLLSVSLG